MKLSLSDEHAEALRELAVSLGGHLALISKPKAADIFVLTMKGLVREIRAKGVRGITRTTNLS